MGTYTTTVLRYSKTMNCVSPLPEGWLQIKHKSGMYFYMEKETKVITWSRPFIAPWPIKNHKIPVASIPCLHYTKVKKKIEEAGQGGESGEKKESTNNKKEEEEKEASAAEAAASSK